MKVSINSMLNNFNLHHRWAENKPKFVLNNSENNYEYSLVKLLVGSIQPETILLYSGGYNVYININTYY